MMLHEPFCIRNFKLCNHCKIAIEIGEFDEHLKNHLNENLANKIPANNNLEKHIDISKNNNQPLFSTGIDTTNLKKQQSLIIQCAYCELTLAESELYDHQIMCGARSDVCEYCNQKLLKKMLKPHLESCTAKLALEQEDYLEYENNEEDDLKLFKQKQLEYDEKLARELMESIDNFDNKLNIHNNDDDETAKRIQMDLDEKLANEIANQHHQQNNQNEGEEELDEDLKRILELSKNEK